MPEPPKSLSNFVKISIRLLVEAEVGMNEMGRKEEDAIYEHRCLWSVVRRPGKVDEETPALNFYRYELSHGAKLFHRLYGGRRIGFLGSHALACTDGCLPI